MSTEACVSDAYHIRPAIWQLVQDEVAERRRIRHEDPSVFRRYAQALLRSAFGPEEE